MKTYSSLCRILACSLALAAAPLPGQTQQPEPWQEAIAELRGEMESLRAEVARLREENETLRASLNEEAAEEESEPAQPVMETVTETSPEIEAHAARSRFGIDFYGYVRLDAYYNSNPIVDQDVPTWVFPPSEGGDGEFGLHAKQTRLGMNLHGPELGGGELSGELAIDFFGETGENIYDREHEYSPRSVLAYLKWDNGDWEIRAGKDWATYTLLYPDTVNFNYFNAQGQLGLRNTQLRLTRRVDLGNGRLIAKAALSDPMGGLWGADRDGDLQDDGMDAELPVFEFALSYERPFRGLERPFIVGVSGLLGRESSDLPVSRDFDIAGVTLAAQVPIQDWLLLMGTIWTGENLDSAWGGVAQGINMATGEEISAAGGWLQLTLIPSPQWRVNLAYGIDDPRNSDLLPGQRSYNEAWYGNIFYEFSPALLYGLEYMRMRTGYLDGAAGEADRVQSAILFRF